ncbi:MAG: MotA/TolQ/ExbB proton channel family protein [Desulfobacteraceae bacterium]|jgi:biopolymer transport protein ExbB
MKVIIIVTLSLLISVSESYAESFDTLLQNIKKQSSKELEQNERREKEFIEAKEKRSTMLRQAKSKAEKLESESETLKTNIDTNEQHITEFEEKLQRKMGDLGELFGIIRQISGELEANLEHSMISVHYPERAMFLQQLSQRKELPDMKELENLWLIMLEELDESRRVSKFTSPVVQEDGTTKAQKVIRIGSYGALSQGAFLTYSAEGNLFAKALKQPPTRYLASADNFDKSEGDFVKIMIDPSRGQLLNMLTQKPDLKDRIRQGGIIGYIIIGLGLSGLLLGFTRYSYLIIVLNRIKKQAANLKKLSTDNPLGRIGLVYKDAQDKSREQKEIVWEEAILKEIPKVEKYNALIKLLAAVSPLLGLLGTVTGMIITFQSITLFGTSDPKLMAGGISTALVTTVLGLTVAIPLLFTYTFIAAKTRNIIDVIEHQSIGLIAKEYA